MHDESNKQPCCNPPWEPPQVIPAQVRRVNNLIFRKINQFHRENNVDNVTPMHDWIMSYLYWHKNEPVYQRDIEREFSITRSTVTNILQLHRAPERAAGCPAETADPDGRGRPRPRKDDALPAPDR